MAAGSVKAVPHVAGRLGAARSAGWTESGADCHGGKWPNPSKGGHRGVVSRRRDHSHAQDGAHTSASVSDGGCLRSDGLQWAGLVIHRRGGAAKRQCRGKSKTEMRQKATLTGCVGYAWPAVAMPHDRGRLGGVRRRWGAESVTAENSRFRRFGATARSDMPDAATGMHGTVCRRGPVCWSAVMPGHMDVAGGNRESGPKLMPSKAAAESQDGRRAMSCTRVDADGRPEVPIEARWTAK